MLPTPDGQKIDHVYALAADMGGMGFISANHSQILHNNVLINTHTIEAARQGGASRYFYTSSACVYPEHLQTQANVVPLKEADAFPAAPQDAYGWEKLFTELLCHYYTGDHGMETRVVRFHNVYGEKGTWEGGREKAPAAMIAEDGGGQAAGRQGGRPRWPTAACPPSRSGATASRRARSCTSTTARRASTA